MSRLSKFVSRRRRLFVETLEQRRLLATYTVNSAGGDGDSFGDDGACDTAFNPNTTPPTPANNVCTLRAALEQSAINGGGDTIIFAIPGDANFVPEIPGGLGIAANVTLDGTTQASGRVIIQGNIVTFGDGATVKGLFVQDTFTVPTNNNTIQDVIAESLHVPGNGNQIGGTGTNDSVVVLAGGLSITGNTNVVEGSFIGFNPETQSVDANPNAAGIAILAGTGPTNTATGNRIGGSAPGAGNVIGGFNIGIDVGSISLNNPVAAAGNIIQGNWIGIDPSGAPIPNVTAGISVQAMGGNQIGGSEAGEGNVISSSGIGIRLLENASNNTIQGNFIGTNVEGTAALPDQRVGIVLDSQGRPPFGPSSNVIGGTDPGAGNVIAGHAEAGIRINNGPTLNTIDGNLIGLSAFEDPLPNGIGVDVLFAGANTIGGPVGNTISANQTGILIAGSTSAANKIQGNRIGTNIDGDVAIGNNTGILINDAPGTLIGGPISEGSSTILGNVISGSIALPAENIFGHGIFIANSNARNTVVQGNRIGTNAAGDAALPNAGDGVLVVSANGTHVGGDGGGLGNLISGNGGDGVTFFGASAAPVIMDAVIEGNMIGTNASGDAAIPNGARGVHLDSNIQGTRVGGDKPGMRNLISGNAADGIIIFGNAAQENEIYGNTIGLDATGTERIPNGESGILIQDSSNNLIGKVIDTDVHGNLISGNRADGLRIDGQLATGNLVIGNHIGVGIIGDEQLGNRDHGVRIIDARDNRIGPYANVPVGSFPTAGNIISDNLDSGIRIEGSASGNQILGNGIGTAALGFVDEKLLVLGNLENGIDIEDASNNWIGGKPTVAIPASASIPEKVAGNVIATNSLDGVRVTGETAIGNRISNNSIFLNGSQGIDLGPPDITDNDGAEGQGFPDTDTGPNLLQNFPVIEDLQPSADRSTIRLVSRLETTPNKTYTVEVFGNFRREVAGQGRIPLTTIDVAVGPTGVANFTVDVPAPQPVPSRGGQRANSFAMTATDPDGNTSEFSASVSAPELVIEDLDFTLEKISFENGAFLFRDTIIVRNEGGRDASGVLVQFRDQDGNTLGPVDQDQFVNLPAPLDEPIDVMIDIEWDITDILLDSGGSKNLQLIATIDPNNTIKELVDDVENNTQSESLFVNIRPVIKESDVKTEYKPGAFFAGVNLENDVIVEAIDWNGNLPGDDLGAGVTRTLAFNAGTATQSTIIFGASTPPFEYTFDIGEDLSPGTTLVTLTATSFSDLPPTVFGINYTQIENPAWIGDTFVTVEDVGNGPYDKVAKYHAGFGFPGFTTDGFFELPVSVKIGSGNLGPEIGSYQVDLDFRSDGIATLTGTAPWSGVIAGRKVLPEVDVELSGTARPANGTLEIVEVSTTVSLAGDVETPSVPLPPPVSFLSAHGELSGSLNATLSVAESFDGTLDWQPAGFGIGVGAALKISAGYQGLAYAEGGIGGNINANFNLPATPCLLDSVTLQFALTAEVQVLVATASYEFNFPDPPFMLAGCGGGGSGEQIAALLAQGENVTPTLKLAQSTAGEHFATLTNDGLPDIRYRYAAPSLAVHDDGTKTLVWVDEDPTKPVEGQLEILAAREVDGVWQTPQTITDDGLIDVQPTVSLMPDGTPVAVWSHVGASIVDPLNPDPYALLGSMDLFYSTFNATDGLWSAPALLTSSVGMDYLPRLTPTDTGVAAAFLTDVDGDTSLFPDDGKTIDSTLRIVEFDGTDWTTPATIASGVDATTAPQAILADLGDGVDGLAAWDSGSLDSGPGMRVAISRGGTWQPTLLLADQPEAVTPQIIKLPGSDAAGLAWLNEQISDGPRPENTIDALYYATFENGQLGTPNLVAKSAGISDPVMTLDDSGRVVIAWIESFSNAVGIGYAVQDVDGVWGSPQRLSTPDGQLPWWLLPYVEDNALHVLNISRTITTNIGPGQGEHIPGDTPILTTPSLGQSTALIAPDLVASALTTSSPAPGTLRVSSTITNTGDLASTATTAHLEADGTVFGTAINIGALAPGESLDVMFDWSEPANPLSTVELSVVADPDNTVTEKNESNNTASIQRFLPDLASKNVVANLDGEDIVVSGEVISTGDIPSGVDAVVRLMLDDPDNGEVFAEITVGSLTVGGVSAFSFTIPNARTRLGGVRTGYIIVDANHAVAEQNERFDNIEIVALNPFRSWTNPDDPFDVEGTNGHTALDALVIINELNRNRDRKLPVPPTPKPFYDPNGDGFVTELDALVIINQLNRESAAAFFGEPIVETSELSSAPQTVAPESTRTEPAPQVSLLVLTKKETPDVIEQLAENMHLPSKWISRAAVSDRVLRELLLDAEEGWSSRPADERWRPIDSDWIRELTELN
ncbi:CARDB domain-containing protein [Aporhodopirellula aestuarii]|uniref:Dockerin type I domain-containing protein n=1 Tax=Aporhodopirellula aestuarii TaxID=2950107 RepID=A0ABT0U430_9BACT|nr:CARDB domain-containing protein [Aporhodopirellula aestuarii]MCM2371111.1 dockerin type I domain-containing protein [Aporhodopirellula aestuarii]